MSYESSQEVQEFIPLNPYGAGATEASEEHPHVDYDNYLIAYDLQTYGVFDGLGEDPGSAHASSLAVHKVYEHLNGQPNTNVSEYTAYYSMKHALRKAHYAILDQVASGATTASVLRFFVDEEQNQRASIGNIGDSRIYRLREGWKLGSLTLDDSTYARQADPDMAWENQNALANVVNINNLSDRQKYMFHGRNVIAQCLGHGSRARLSVSSIDVQENDLFLLTTDGIHDNLTTDEIEEILKAQNDPKAIAADLIEAAQIRSRSGHLRAKPDDMTAVVVNVPRA